MELGATKAPLCPPCFSDMTQAEAGRRRLIETGSCTTTATEEGKKNFFLVMFLNL